MNHSFAWHRLGTCAAIVLAVLVVATANVGVAQDSAAGTEPSANTKPIPAGIVVVGLGISEVRSDPSDEKNVGIDVLPTKELLLAFEAYRQVESTKPLKLLYQKLYPKLSLEVHGVQDAVLLRGTVESDEIREQLREIAEQLFPKVLDQLHVQPVASPGINSSEVDVDPFVQIGDDRGGIRATLGKLFPKAKLEVNFANEAVIIRGRVARSTDITSIVDVAERYFPRVLPYIVADDQQAAAAPPSVGSFGGTGQPSVVSVPIRDDQDAAMDRESKQLTLRVRAAQEPEKSKLRTELELLTEKHFEHRQRRRDAEVAELADRADKLRVAQHRRQENKADILKRRVAELLDPDKKLDWDDASGKRGGDSARRGSPDPAARPTAGLTTPGFNADDSPSRGVAEKTRLTEEANKAATAALIRAAEARRKIAEAHRRVAEHVLTRVEDANKKVPGAVTGIELERMKAILENAEYNLEIAEAELDAAKAGVDISRESPSKSPARRSPLASDPEEVN